MTTMFVSGHIDITQDEFDAFYVPTLEWAADEGASFVVGDAPGCDLMTQQWLHCDNAQRQGLGIPTNEVTVCHMLEVARYNFGSNRSTIGGFKSDEERDAAMTAISDADIAWVRPNKNKRNSGTAKNLARRKEKKRSERIAERASWPRMVVGECDRWPDKYLSLPNELNGYAHAIPVPSGLKERTTAAFKAYQACQAEISALIFEEENLEDGFRLNDLNTTEGSKR